MSRWSDNKDAPRGADYDARWERLAAQGESIHGEADFLEGLGPRSVLDAGCGTGRVTRELAARGFDVVGVDLDETMLATARTKSPDLTWILGDVATVQLGRRFGMVAMPGNVMILVASGTETQVVANMAAHLEPGGLLVAGFQLGARRPYGLAAYDQDCSHVGLELRERWGTWDEEPYNDGNYAVSVHQLNVL